jgi:hypothetical protein
MYALENNLNHIFALEYQYTDLDTAAAEVPCLCNDSAWSRFTF